MNGLRPRIAALIASAIAGAAAAQTSTTAPPADAPPSPTAAQPGLADQPFRLDSIGLTMYLPVGASVESSRVGTKTTAAIRAPDDTWLINIQTHETKDVTSTIKEALEKTIALMQGSYGETDKDQKVIVSTQTKILDRTDSLNIGEQPAARVYMLTPQGNGSHLFRGYTILKPSPNLFVVFELLTQESEAKRVRPIYETTVASAHFEDPEAMALKRGTAVKAGVNFLSNLTKEDYAAVLDGQERWFRLYQPAPGGAEQDAREIAYRSIKGWQGQLGEIDPTRPKSNWSPTDRRSGYLVRVAARQLVQGMIADTEGRYFMTPDRKVEAWSLRTALRDGHGANPSTYTETGFREGDQMKVVISQSGKPDKTIKPLIQSEGYATQVENLLIPVLLARAGAEADFAFYVYQSQAETISMRRDSVQRDPDRAGALTVKTIYRAGQDPRTAVFNEKGQMMRAEEADGSVWEPTTPQILHRLWQSKGLPTK